MIDFTLTEQQQELRDRAHKYAAEEVRPLAVSLDQQVRPEDGWSWDLYEKGNRLGFNKLITPKEYGGQGYGDLEYAIAIEELAWGDAGVATTYFAHTYALRELQEYGTPEQKDRFLRALCNDPTERYFINVGGTEHGDAGGFSAGEYMHRRAEIGTVSISPEAWLQSEVPFLDRREVITTAVEDGDDYVVNGLKHFITSGGRGSLVVLFAKFGGPDAPDSALGRILVPTDFDGVSYGHLEDKMGHRLSQQQEIRFTNVRVPREYSMGQVGLAGLSTGNAGCAALCVGLSRAAYEEAINYAKARYKAGANIIHHQAVGMMLTDMAIGIDTARLLCWQGAWENDHVSRESPRACMAKAYASDTALMVTQKAVQVFGGYGYMRDFPVEKYYRESKLTQIYDGSNEILRLRVVLPWLANLNTI